MYLSIAETNKYWKKMEWDDRLPVRAKAWWGPEDGNSAGLF